MDTCKSGEFVVSGGEDKVLRVWESSTGRCLSRVALPDTITSVKWNKVTSNFILVLVLVYSLQVYNYYLEKPPYLIIFLLTIDP